MTPEQMADLIRAQVMLDRALDKVRALPLTYPLVKRIENLQGQLWANIGAEHRAYEAGSALYDTFWGDRWEEDAALDAKRLDREATGD